MRWACSGRIRRAGVTCAAVVLGSLSPAAATGLSGEGVAWAAPTASDLRAARDLFAQAEKDEDAGRWADALDALRRVAHVKLTAGVRYHVALCEEHLGQLATALGDYATAEAQARTENAQDVLRLVGKQTAALSSRIPRLTVHVAPELPDAEVRVDGQPVPPAKIGVATPVDPGVHHIEATAPGRPTSTANVTLNEHDATDIEMRLGELTPSAGAAATATPAPGPAAEAPALATAPAPETAAAPSTSPRTGALVATIGSVILAGGGVAAFVLAGNAVSSGRAECAALRTPEASACDSEKSTVRTWDWIAASAWAGAAVAGAVAVVLWTRPAHHGAAAASARLVIGPASLGVGGAF